MMRRVCISMLAVSLLFSPAAGMAEEAPRTVQPEEIMPYLEQVIAWRHDIGHTEQISGNSREVLLKNRICATALQALQNAFAFARAQTAVFAAEDAANGKTPAPADDRRGKLTKAADDAGQRISDLQDKLKVSDLSAGDRETYNGQLKLAQAQQELLQTMMHIVSTEDIKSGSLRDQVDALALQTVGDTVEQSAPTTSKPPASTASATSGTVTPAQDKDPVLANNGMFSLSSSIFTLSRKRDQIKALIAETKALSEKNRDLVQSLRTALHTALAQGNALSAPNGGGAKDLSGYHKSIDALVTHYKQLAASIVPLGTMNVLLDGTQNNLREWEVLIQEDWDQVIRQLVMRIAIFSIALAIPLICSAIVHRAIDRYVQDPKRRSQLRIARRIVLYIVLTLVILANFMTEFGSLATFAGFITAGLAVALQTVLISLVAHFFFFGRYGVRAGDRINVNGVTGDVVQIGMLRLYMQELKEEDSKFTPTGKLVAFPNSILFQPSAFYKYMNSTDI